MILPLRPFRRRNPPSPVTWPNIPLTACRVPRDRHRLVPPLAFGDRPRVSTAFFAGGLLAWWNKPGEWLIVIATGIGLVLIGRSSVTRRRSPIDACLDGAISGLTGEPATLLPRAAVCGGQLGDRQRAFDQAVVRDSADDIQPERPEAGDVRIQGGWERHLDEHGDSRADDLERSDAGRAWRSDSRRPVPCTLGRAT